MLNDKSFFHSNKHKKHLKLINWWGRRQTNGHQGPSLCHSRHLFRELVCRNCQIAGASLVGGQGCWVFSCLQPLHYKGCFTRRSSCPFWQRFRPHISSFKATLMDSKLEHDHSWATGTSDTKSTPQSVGQHQRHSETLLLLITTTWSTLCEGDVLHCVRQMVVTPDTDCFSDPGPSQCTKTAHFRVALYCGQPKAHLCINYVV